LASENVEQNLSEEDQVSLKNVFYEIERQESCYHIQKIVEENSALIRLERRYDLPKGFLFPIFLGTNYEKLALGNNLENFRRIAKLIANVWKTEVSVERIDTLIDVLNDCYPY